MSIQVTCTNPDCRQAISVTEEQFGKRARCKKCGTRFTLMDNGKSSAAKITQADLKATLPNDGVSREQVKRLGRFEIRGRLGSGAFGMVFRAYDPQLDREVALKVPHATRLRNSRFIKRFLNEARLAARLQHPNIVPVFDAGRDGKRYYIASACIQGRTLDAALKNDAMDFRQSARIVMQLAEALAYAHKQNIIHRDVKPDNVMLDDNGEPHLMDFGLARLETSDEKLTQGGGILGTPAYMLPEQAGGDVDKSDEPDESGVVAAESDQYSLGVTLYELLCGELPFSGPPEVVIFNVLNTDPPTPRSIQSEIPRDLETICQKAMSKEPVRRYDDCHEFAEDLQRWLDDEPIQARRIGQAERLMRWCRRNPMIAGLGALSVALLLMVTVISAAGFASTNAALFESETHRRQAERNQEEADKQREFAKQQSIEARQQTRIAQQANDRMREALRGANRNLFISQVVQMRHDWDNGRFDTVHDRLRVTRPERTDNIDVREFEWHYWNRLYNRSFIRLKGHSEVPYDVTFSPDGSRLASVSRDKMVKVRDTVTGKEMLTLKGHQDIPTGVAFSPDGTQLVSGSSRTVKLWGVASIQNDLPEGDGQEK